jgi:hypothetical protein
VKIGEGIRLPGRRVQQSTLAFAVIRRPERSILIFALDEMANYKEEGADRCQKILV